jgi:hypothetical protein
VKRTLFEFIPKPEHINTTHLSPSKKGLWLSPEHLWA